ncbi:MAG: hypothetical protein HY099_05985 [Nitrospirae bacterium]|nr:hypothetical protein [Nitrospirota bacterium]
MMNFKEAIQKAMTETGLKPNIPEKDTDAAAEGFKKKYHGANISEAVLCGIGHLAQDVYVFELSCGTVESIEIYFLSSEISKSQREFFKEIYNKGYAFR